MSTESESAPQLTLNDPVDKATLARLEQLNQARLQIAEQLLELENEKVRLLVAARPIEQERMETFSKILKERNLPIDFGIVVDGATGKITSQDKP